MRPRRRRIRQLQTRHGERCRSTRADAWRPDSCTLDVVVRNLTGHKLPTGYPVAPRLAARDACATATARTVFESGALDAPRRASRATTTTPIASRFEPHYEEIRRAGPGADLRVGHGRPAGAVTTGLLTGDAVRQGQPPAAARVRQGDRAQRTSPSAEARARTAISPATAIASAIVSIGAARPVRSVTRSSCGISRSRSGGPTTSRLRRRRATPFRLVLRRHVGAVIGHRRERAVRCPLTGSNPAGVS